MIALLDDGPGGSGPDEGGRGAAGLVETVAEGHLQIGDGREHAATDALSSDCGEDALDRIEAGMAMSA